MNFIMVNISMADFAVMMLMESHCIGIFEAAWMNGRKVVRDRQSLCGTLSMIGKELPLVYIITVNGGDDAEDFVIDEMLLCNLPAVAIFSRGGKVEHKSEVDSDGNVNKNLFLSEYNRIRDCFPSRLNTESSPSSKSEISNLATPVTRAFLLENIVSLIFSNMKTQNKIRTKGADLDIHHTDRGASDVLTLYLSGDKSSVGKSSLCLAILGSLIRLGVDPSAIAYIKPVTQCEAEQPVTDYCSRVGIAHCGVGPIVFYKGFTRAYLRKETLSDDILKQKAVDAVNLIGVGKRIVIVDGVGYPSVGSICNLSNADIASALNAPVLLVGKSGVGDAVDSFNMNARFFESYGVTVLGGIFNKIPLEGFYNLESCREAVTSYFNQYCPEYTPYGFIPLIPPEMEKEVSETESINIISGVPSASSSTNSNPDFWVEKLVGAFLEHVDVGQLLFDIFKFSVVSRGVKICSDMYNDSVLSLKQYREEKQQHRNRRYQEEQGTQYGLKGDGTNKKRSNSVSCSSNDFSTTVKIRKLEGEEESSFIDADPGSAANPHNLLTKNRTSNSNKSYPKQMSQHQPLSRDEIEALAVSQGAKMGG